MQLPQLLRPLGVSALALILGASLVSAQTSERPSRATRAPAKGPLPDPAILDGSKEPAEKRPEFGMLGEFEMPGDENAQSDRVGGGSQQQQQQSGGGQQQQQGAGGGGGGSQPPDPNAKEGGGGGQQQQQQQQQGQGSGQIAQGNDGRAEGLQSSGLQSPDGGAAASQSSAPPAKPGNMKIGDATMQIKTLPAGTASQVVGVQQQPTGKETPQSYDVRTPGGGKQSTGRGNSGVEKGKVMPPGL